MRGKQDCVGPGGAFVMPDVFISYSRKDKAFVQKLHTALAADGREIWIDWEGIPLSADWWAEIAAGIEGSNAFVFVISPDSIVSEVCSKEISHAEKHNKRLLPILYREVDAKQVPPAVSSLNWIFFRETDDFEGACRALIATLNTDLEWAKAHTRLTQRAVEWEARGRSDSYLLRGEDLAGAEQRLAQMQNDPPLTELQAEYILASRQSATKRQRLVIGAVSAGLVISIILGIVAFLNFLRAEEQYQLADIARQTAEANEQLAWQAVAEAETERNRAATAEALAYLLLDQAEADRAIATSRELAADALLNAEQDPELAILLALQAMAITPTIQAEEALHLALQAAGVEPTFNQEDNLLNINYTGSGSGSPINDLAYSPDGRYLAAGDDDTLRIWQTDTGQLLHTLQGHQNRITSLAFSPDGRQVVSGSFDATAKIWEVASGQEQLTLGEGGYTAWINNVAVSADGRWLATAGNDGVIKLWEAASGARQAILEGHAGPVRSLSFSPDSSRLASVGLDGVIQIWNVASGEAWQTLPTGHAGGALGITFSAGGETLATAGADGQVKLWDIETGQLRQTLSGHRAEVLDLAFSPGGDRLGSLSADGQVKVWSLNNPGDALTLPGHRAGLQALTFSPDGRQLIAGGDDGKLRLYLLDSETLQNLARSRVSRTLTPAECQKYLHQEQCPG